MACQEQERASHTTNHARYVSHSMMFSSSLVPLSLQANMSGARYTELQGVNKALLSVSYPTIFVML